MRQRNLSRAAVQLAALCSDKGTSQRVVAETIGRNKSTVHRWITGAMKPDIDSAFALEDSFGIVARGWVSYE